jgi:hypothetical protein
VALVRSDVSEELSASFLRAARTLPNIPEDAILQGHVPLNSNIAGTLDPPKFVMLMAREGVPASALFTQTLCTEDRVLSDPLHVLSYSNATPDNPLTQVKFSFITVLLTAANIYIEFVLHRKHILSPLQINNS